MLESFQSQLQQLTKSLSSGEGWVRSTFFIIKLTHIPDSNLKKYCAENASNALNVAFQKKMYYLNLNFHPVSQELLHSLPSPPLLQNQ